MELKVEMEDGTFALVADTFMDITRDGYDFRVHNWGDVWLVATLDDDTRLIDEDGHWMSMHTLRRLDAGTTVHLKTGGEPRRQRTFKDRVGINKDARPFSKE